MNKISIFTDGACRGNPGLASIGVYAVDDTGQPLFTVSEFLGYDLTNNVAEYTAIAVGLERFLEESKTATWAAAKPLAVEIVSDSELAVKQLNGLYKIKNDRIRQLFNRIMSLKVQFSHLTFRHIKREGNKQADSLANQALDNLK